MVEPVRAVVDPVEPVPVLVGVELQDKGATVEDLTSQV
jgi:hypothetical protein